MKDKKQKRKWNRHCALFALLFVMGVCLFGRTSRTWAGTMSGVQNLHQTDSSGLSFTVEWDKDINAEGYEFQYSVDGRNWSSSAYTSSLEKQVYGLNSGRSYYVRMRSVSDINGYYDDSPTKDAVYSDWTEPLEVVTEPERVLAEEIRQTGGSNTSVTVTWTAAEGATEYDVEYYMGGSWFYAGTTTQTSYTVEGLEPDTWYDVAVAAVRESAAGYRQGHFGYGHSCYTMAPKVKDLTLSSWETKKNRITIAWADNSSYNTGFEVYVTNLAGKKVKNFKTTETSEEFQLSSIKNQGFCFRVRAYKDIDGTTVYGPYSSTKTVVAQPGLTIKRAGKKALTLTWKKVKGASGYTVYRSTSPYTGFKKLKTVKSAKLTNKGLNRNKNYYYYVVANGVKVNKKTYKSTAAKSREIAYLDYYGKTAYIYQ